LSSISSDGRYVVFQSVADNLVANDGNGKFDVFLRDTWNGTTELVSQNAAGEEGNDASWPGYAGLTSADGRLVAFSSRATNLIADDANGVDDIFIRNRLSGTIERVSVSSSGTPADGLSAAPTMTLDARYVAFTSEATNLVASGSNGLPQIFLRDRVL